MVWLPDLYPHLPTRLKTTTLDGVACTSTKEFRVPTPRARVAAAARVAEADAAS